PAHRGAGGEAGSGEPRVRQRARDHRVVAGGPVELPALVLDADEAALRTADVAEEARPLRRVGGRVAARLVDDLGPAPVLVAHAPVGVVRAEEGEVDPGVARGL